MTQYSLFSAADYVQQAYDNLVRATDAVASSELDSLKWQMLQAWLSLQQARMASASTEPEALPLGEEPF